MNNQNTRPYKKFILEVSLLQITISYKSYCAISKYAACLMTKYSVV